MADQIQWRVSGWDHNVHGFRALTEVSSEAACKHSALTSKLAESTGGERICPACAQLLGDQLGQLASARAHERDRWGL